MGTMNLHIIANPFSGSGNGHKTLTTTKNYLTQQNVPFHIYETHYAGHEKELVKTLVKEALTDWEHQADTFPLLTVIGGDGTLHQVLNAIQDYPNIPIAYIPGGSGNDFARGAGIPLNTKQAIDNIIQLDIPKSINLLQAMDEDNKTLSVLNNVGIGLDAFIVSTANQSAAKKRLNQYGLGSLSYLFAAIKVLFQQKSFPIAFTLDNKETISFDKAYLCTTTNHPYFGGGIALDPTASLLDDEFSLVIVEKINLFKIIFLAMQLLNKKHLGSKHVHHFKGKSLNISSIAPEHGQVDGEALGQRSYQLQFELKERLMWI